MKILIITQSGNLTYGAAKSLQLIMNNIPFEFDIIFQKTILKDYSEEELRNYVGDKCNEIFFYDLPLYYSIMNDYSFWKIEYSYGGNFRKILSAFYRKVLFLLNRNKINSLIKEGNYDCVYLNSSILYPLIQEEIKTVIHIRELVKEKLPTRVINKIQKADTAICIDKPVYDHLVKSCKTMGDRIKILTNPFDMKLVEKCDSSAIREKFEISCNDVVFLVAGIINKPKGVEYVLDEFLRTKTIDKRVLLIAGRNDTEYATSLMKNVADIDNIKFIGEIINMENIYAITDYLVRGENEFCTGRTVYEALFSGCSVIIPGTSDNKSDMKLYSDQMERVYFYEPRKKGQLTQLFGNLSKMEKEKCVNTNVPDFINEFVQIIS